jgi:hypothetical protein
MRFSVFVLLWLYFSIVRFIARLATRPLLSLKKEPSLFGFMLRKHLRRPQWLYYPGVDLYPVKQFYFSPISKTDAAQIQLCKRLIDAYKLACMESPPLNSASDLWKKIIHKYHHRLIGVLDKKDPQALGQIFSSMFQQDFMWGITMGARALDPGYACFIRMRMVMDILALAESLGVVRTEALEQGELGHGLKEGLPALVKKIERQIGVSIDFPRLGGAYGFDVKGTLITSESPEHIYVACRINEAISRLAQLQHQGAPRILEIGAGYGGMVYWLSRFRKDVVNGYTILDLPMVNVIQGYFLGNVFGPDRIRLYGEPPLGEPGIEIIPAHAKEKATAQEFDLLINENSMPEMPEAVVKDYLSWAKTRLNGIFYSYNQEAYSPVNGIPQTWVPKAIADVGNYRRLSRNYSWVRPGYVEEVYVVSP